GRGFLGGLEVAAAPDWPTGGDFAAGDVHLRRAAGNRVGRVLPVDDPGRVGVSLPGLGQERDRPVGHRLTANSDLPANSPFAAAAPGGGWEGNGGGRGGGPRGGGRRVRAQGGSEGSGGPPMGRRCVVRRGVASDGSVEVHDPAILRGAEVPPRLPVDGR